jgi:hypothetical protein
VQGFIVLYFPPLLSVHQAHPFPESDDPTTSSPLGYELREPGFPFSPWNVFSLEVSSASILVHSHDFLEAHIQW